MNSAARCWLSAALPPFPKTMTLPGGSARQFTYDPLMRLKDITSKDPGQNTLINYQYTFDKMDNITAKQTEYEGFVQTIFGPEGRVAEKNSELVRPIVDKINLVLKQIGDDEGYTMVFDASIGGIVYAADGIDLTDRVLEELNKGLE